MASVSESSSYRCWCMLNIFVFQLILFEKSVKLMSRTLAANHINSARWHCPIVWLEIINYFYCSDQKNKQGRRAGAAISDTTELPVLPFTFSLSVCFSLLPANALHIWRCGPCVVARATARLNNFDSATEFDRKFRTRLKTRQTEDMVMFDRWDFSYSSEIIPDVNSLCCHVNILTEPTGVCVLTCRQSWGGRCDPPAQWRRGGLRTALHQNRFQIHEGPDELRGEENFTGYMRVRHVLFMQLNGLNL